ncbi:hypothetical protein ACO2JO_04840 [Leptospira interrogans]
MVQILGDPAADSAAGGKVFATSYESALREAGDVLVVPNQGQGAASARMETARRHFPRPADILQRGD